MDYIENLQFEQLSLPFGEESPKQETKIELLFVSA